MLSFTTIIPALSLVSSVVAQSSVAELVASLREAPTEVDRFRLLEDDQFLFDFVNPNTTVGVTNGAGGHTVAATSDNFAAVVGNGVSMTIGFLGPCGMNTPHTHPRATEINFSVNATLRGGVLVENGARFAEIDIRPGTATVFPQGAIHFEMNPTCEPAMFVASFNAEDPGVNQVAQRYFGLPPDIVGAALGGLGVEEIAGLEALIPDNVAYGTDECLARCGITRGEQATSQRQPRVSANAFPAGITTAYPAGATAGSEAGVEPSEEATTYYSSYATTYTTEVAEATPTPARSEAATSSYAASSAASTYSSEAPTYSSEASSSSYYSSAAAATATSIYSSGAATSTYYSSAPAATSSAYPASGSSEPATGESGEGAGAGESGESTSEGEAAEGSDGDSAPESSGESCEGEDCASASPSAPYYPPSSDNSNGDGITIIIEENGSQAPAPVYAYGNKSAPTYGGNKKPSSWRRGYKFGADARSM